MRSADWYGKRGREMRLSTLMIGSTVLALVSGAIFGEVSWLQYSLKELGNIFVALIKIAVIPIAFISITKAILDIGNTKKLSFVTFMAFSLAIGMSVVGVILGGCLMAGIGATMVDVGKIAIEEVKSPTVLEFIRNCIPTNPFKSFAEGNMLQIITMAFFIGISSLFVEGKEKISNALDIMQKVCFKIAGYAMWFAPIGVFSLLYPVVAKSFNHVIQGYFIMAGLLLLGSIIYTVFFSLPLLHIFKVNGFKLLKTITFNDIVYAISGGASASLTQRIDFLKKETSISHELIDYLSPLVSVLMRAGSCICVGIYTVYAASIYDINLSPEKLVVAVFLTVIALTCAPGIIGGTLMDCAIIWAAIGIPIEAIALLAGMDYIMDLIRTVLNIQCGEIVTACVDGAEKRKGIIQEM